MNDFIFSQKSELFKKIKNYLSKIDNELMSSSLVCELTFSDTNKKLNTITNLYSLMINYIFFL